MEFVYAVGLFLLWALYMSILDWVISKIYDPNKRNK